MVSWGWSESFPAVAFPGAGAAMPRPLLLCSIQCGLVDTSFLKHGGHATMLRCASQLANSSGTLQPSRAWVTLGAEINVLEGYVPRIYDEPRMRAYRRMAGRIGARIRTIREQRGVSQRELSIALGRSPSWASQLEAGVNAPNIMDLMMLSDFLETPISYFLSDTGHVTGYLVPQSSADWATMFPGEPERAAAHEAIDRVYRDARQVLRARLAAGISA